MPGGSEAAWREWLYPVCYDTDDPDEHSEDDTLDMVHRTLKLITAMVEQGMKVGSPDTWHKHHERELNRFVDDRRRPKRRANQCNRIVKRTLLIAAAFCAVATVASAQDLPVIDVDGACNAVHKDNPIAIDDCIKKEQSWYDQSNSIWSKLSTESQRYCIDAAEGNNVNAQSRTSYYLGMVSCLLQRQQVEQYLRDQTAPRPTFQPN